MRGSENKRVHRGKGGGGRRRGSGGTEEQEGGEEGRRRRQRRENLYIVRRGERHMTEDGYK